MVALVAIAAPWLKLKASLAVRRFVSKLETMSFSFQLLALDFLNFFLYWEDLERQPASADLIWRLHFAALDALSAKAKNAARGYDAKACRKMYCIRVLCLLFFFCRVPFLNWL